MGMMKDLSIQDGFICDACELPGMQSPTWDDLCVPCTIAFLESDLEINRAAMKNV
jgi:hypothetical protein